MMVVLMEVFAVGAGLLVSSRLEGYSRLERLAVSLALGLAFFLWLPYLSARWAGIESGTWVSFLILASTACAGLAWTTSSRFWSGIRQAAVKTDWLRPSYWLSGSVIIAITILFGYLLFNHSLRVRNGGLWSAGVSCEDMGFHATLANAFTNSREIVLHPVYPILPNWPLGYPFLPDFSAATAMVLGSPIGFGFFSTAAFAFLALLANLYSIARRWLPPSYSALTIFLFLFGGNLGIYFLLRDLQTSSLSQIWMQDYANNFNLSLNYGNIATDVLLPMRTSLFGAPIAFAIILIISRGPVPTLTEKIVTGILFGSLPLINAHSFMAVTVYAAVYSLHDPVGQIKKWWPALLIAVVLAVPQVFWIQHQLSASVTPFIRRANGFLFETTLSWPTYWLLNGGLFVPLGIAAWFFADPDLKFMTLPLIVWLPLCMVMSFQPNTFDNIKLLLFFHFGSALLIADFCRRSFERGRGRIVVATIAVIISTATGVHSWARETQVPCEMATAADREFAARVLETTDEHSMILTAQHYTHPVPFLTGRTIVLGFHNWLGMSGIPYDNRAKDVNEIYSGSKRAPELIAKYGITDITVGPFERQEFPKLNERFLEKISKGKIISGLYTMYRLRQ